MSPKALSSIIPNIWNKPAHVNTPGLYHFIRERPGERTRLHLRIDPDGQGIVIVNANRILHLNPSAALMARLFKPNSQATLAPRSAQYSLRCCMSPIEIDYAQFT